MSGPHCFCATDQCQITTCKKCGDEIPETDKRRILHDLCLTCKAAMIPKRSRWQAGIRAQVHGYTGQASGYPADGFRGTIEGWMGRTLIGICDDGREWYQSPSLLDKEGSIGDNCICCAEKRQSFGIQETLF